MTNKEIVELTLDTLLGLVMERCPEFADEVFQIIDLVEIYIAVDEEYNLAIIAEIVDVEYLYTRVHLKSIDKVTGENNAAEIFPDIVRELDRYKRLAKI